MFVSILYRNSSGAFKSTPNGKVLGPDHHLSSFQRLVTFPVVPHNSLPRFALVALFEILSGQKTEVATVEPPSSFVSGSTVLFETVILAIECAERMVVVVSQTVSCWQSCRSSRRKTYVQTIERTLVSNGERSVVEINFIVVERRQVDSEHVVILGGHEVHDVVAQPKFTFGVSEAILVAGPVLVESGHFVSEVTPSHNNLKLKEKCN